MKKIPLVFILLFLSCGTTENIAGPTEEEIQKRIDDAVSAAVEEVIKEMSSTSTINEDTSTTSTTTSTTSTTTSTTSTTTSTTSTTTSTTSTTIPMNIYTAGFEASRDNTMTIINPYSEMDTVQVTKIYTNLELSVEKSGQYAIWNKINIEAKNIEYNWEGSIAKAFSDKSSNVKVSLIFDVNHFIRYKSDRLAILPSNSNNLKIEGFFTNDYNFDIYTTTLIGNYTIIVDGEEFQGLIESKYDTRGSGADLYTDVASDFSTLVNFDFQGKGGADKGWSTLIDDEFGGIKIAIKPYRFYFNSSKDTVNLTLKD